APLAAVACRSCNCPALPTTATASLTSPVRQKQNGRSIMEPPVAEHGLRERFFTAMLEATFPLKTGPDPELTLQLLIQAADLVKAHLEKELAELRLELVE